MKPSHTFAKTAGAYNTSTRLETELSTKQLATPLCPKESNGMPNRNGLLMVANWDSNVGYAWWLMESFWAAIANEFTDHRSRIAYPSISTVPEIISQAPIELDLINFTQCGARSVIEQCAYLRRHRIKTIYLTDQVIRHWRYAMFRLCGVRSIVVHDHTPGLRTKPKGIKRLIKSALNRLPWITVDKAIGATEFVRDRIVNVGCLPAAKCFAAPNGIVFKPAQPADLHALFGIPTERKVIVTVSRASKYKGIHRAIEWLSGVNQDWHYLFCGDGPDLEEFKRLAAELGISDRVTFAGNRKDVASLLPSCYAAIAPTDGEVGYSLAILEYMAASLPVIVPDNQSVRGATTTEIGFIYSNKREAVEALNSILSDEQMARRMGAAAMAEVRRRFSLTSTHRNLINALRAPERAA